MCRVVFIALLLIGLLPIVAAAEKDAVIIANQAVEVSSVTSSELRDIYLGHKRRWSNGDNLRFVICHQIGFIESFLDRYIGMTRRQYNDYWKKLVFSGRSRAPESYYSPEQVLRVVQQDPTAVGIVPSGMDLSGVKILSVISEEK